MIYRLLKDYLELRLYHKSLSTETDMYEDLKSIQTDVNGDKHYILYTKREKRNANLRRDAENKISLLQLLTQEPIETPVAENPMTAEASETGGLENGEKPEKPVPDGNMPEKDTTQVQTTDSK